jgi:DNA-binding CsgD family transcriptional regulator
MLGARTWLRLANDDIDGALAEIAPGPAAAQGAGLLRPAALAFAHLATAEFLGGRWDSSIAHGERAVALAIDADDHSILSYVCWPASVVAAYRGDAAASRRHAEAAARAASSPAMRVDAALCAAGAPAARGASADVVAVLEPLATEPRMAAYDPAPRAWQHLYAEALVLLDRLDEAEAFLAEHDARAAARNRQSLSARLARVRGMLQAARGQDALAEQAFRDAVSRIAPLPLPFQRAMIELRYGQFLRRRGQRRAATEQLQRAHATFVELDARPALEVCDGELQACGLTPVRGDATRLTPQEAVVARLVISGKTNREVAADLLLSVKTIEVHVSRVLAKTGARSRTQLGVLLRPGALQRN